jgi:Zn-dependent protease with chaperone function
LGVRLRAVGSVVLLVGFFVLLAALLATLVVSAIYALASGRASGLTLALAAIVVLVAVGAALRKVLKVKVQPHGALVGRAEQPELWQMIDDVAFAIDTRGPDEVRIVPEVNAAAWEDSRLLGLSTGRRYLELGLPLLGGMSVSELRAVVGHELGHFSHGHTTLSALTYRATMTMQRTVDGLDGVPRRLLGGYLKLYALASRSTNRAQESQADIAAVRAAGRTATCAALGKLPALSVAWGRYLDSYVSLVPDAGRTPYLLLGFNAFLADPTRRSQLAQFETEQLDLEPTSLFDSHPPIRQRLAAVGALPVADQPIDHRPAWSVLHDPASAIPRFEAALLLDELGPRAPWDQIVQLAGAATVNHNADVLARAALQAGVARSGALGEILDALQQGQGEQMVAPVLSTQPRHEAAAETLTDLVTDFVVAAMIRTGIAWHELDWAGPWRVRLADGREFDPATLVDPIITNPGHVCVLRNWLIASGVPLGYIPALDTPQPARV